MKSLEINAGLGHSAAASVADPAAASLRATHAASGITADFGRKLHMVLGLPFDVIDAAEAESRMRAAIATRSRLFISTPNTNFVITSRTDAAFRNSVLHSDLSLMDGMPIVWVARWLGLTVPERVSGSGLFERLGRAGAPSVSTYFFGGQPGAASAASARLNAQGGPVRCVGFDGGGFGSIEAMSDDATIERINASGADFLVVALGAKKGQAWIEHNLLRLRVPVISHLGAVVNFVGGSLRRAPGWMQSAGLEWLWRIKEEPQLWHRYVSDAWALGRLLLTGVLPATLDHALRWSPRRAARFSHRLDETADGATLSLVGSMTAHERVLVQSLCASLAAKEKPVTVDLAQVQHWDSACLAWLALLRSHRQRCGLPVRFTGMTRASERGLRRWCATWLTEALPESRPK